MTAKKSETRDAGKDAGGQQSFEQALERLERIVERMESGSLALEEMMARFEEGRNLVRFCADKLNEVERKIEILVKKEDGTVETAPFDAGNAEETDSEPAATAEEEPTLL